MASCHTIDGPGHPRLLEFVPTGAASVGDEKYSTLTPARMLSVKQQQPYSFEMKNTVRSVSDAKLPNSDSHSSSTLKAAPEKSNHATAPFYSEHRDGGEKTAHHHRRHSLGRHD